MRIYNFDTSWVNCVSGKRAKFVNDHLGWVLTSKFFPYGADFQNHRVGVNVKFDLTKDKPEPHIVAIHDTEFHFWLSDKLSELIDTIETKVRAYTDLESNMWKKHAFPFGTFSFQHSMIVELSGKHTKTEHIWSFGVYLYSLLDVSFIKDCCSDTQVYAPMGVWPLHVLSELITEEGHVNDIVIDYDEWKEYESDNI
jgi:hypothetical protein